MTLDRSRSADSRSARVQGRMTAPPDHPAPPKPACSRPATACWSAAIRWPPICRFPSRSRSRRACASSPGPSPASAALSPIPPGSSSCRTRAAALAEGGVLTLETHFRDQAIACPKPRPVAELARARARRPRGGGAGRGDAGHPRRPGDAVPAPGARRRGESGARDGAPPRPRAATMRTGPRSRAPRCRTTCCCGPAAPGAAPGWRRPSSASARPPRSTSPWRRPGAPPAGRPSRPPSSSVPAPSRRPVSAARADGERPGDPRGGADAGVSDQRRQPAPAAHHLRRPAARRVRGRPRLLRPRGPDLPPLRAAPAHRRGRGGGPVPAHLPDRAAGDHPAHHPVAVLFHRRLVPRGRRRLRVLVREGLSPRPARS